MRTIFFDVDTQLDFLYPAGALYGRGAEEIVNGLRKLTSFAATNRIQIISTMDAHTEDDPEFKIWKPHCVVGTTGQQKTAATLLANPQVLTASSREDAPQTIVEKQDVHCFTNPNLRPFLDVLKADRYVVYGVFTDICVRHAAFGLLDTGAQVVLVTDAIKGLNATDERDTIERFQAQGGRLTTVATVIG